VDSGRGTCCVDVREWRGVAVPVLYKNQAFIQELKRLNVHD
jgi:hypothetical protein